MSGRYPRVGTDSSAYAQETGLKPPPEGGLGHQLDNTRADRGRDARPLAVRRTPRGRRSAVGDTRTGLTPGAAAAAGLQPSVRPKKRSVRSQAICAQAASYCVIGSRRGPCAVSFAKPCCAR